MLIPSFNTCFLVSFAFIFSCFNIWFLFFSVEIFMDEVKNSSDTFLRVVLFISFKDVVKLTKIPFEEIRSDAS